MSVKHREDGMCVCLCLSVKQASLWQRRGVGCALPPYREGGRGGDGGGDQPGFAMVTFEMLG